MRHARRRIVRRATRLAAVGGVILGGLMVTQAVATEPPRAANLPLSSAQAAGTTGTGLVGDLGTDRTAGSWIADDGKPVVAVTDDEAAVEVEKAGARPKVVDYSMNDLRSATETLRSAPRVTGTAWSVDYTNNEVVVQVDSTVSAADWARLSAVAEEIGGSVRMERTRGTFTTRINAAQPILSTGGRCSAGFNVTNGTADFILTAGHCGPNGSVWFSDTGGSQEIGKTISGSFPINDYSLVQYNGGSAGDGADVVAIGDGRGVRITGAADPAVGQKVFRSGSTTGLRDGEVTGLNATVNYPEGTVSGLIETTVCAESGDSGGPLFSEGIALGITSGGNGDCRSGGTTFFQPVTKALAALNVRLIGQAGQAAAPAPSASATQSAVAPGDAQPGSVAPVTGSTAGEALLDRLADPKNVGPGLLIVGGSLIALVATRWFRVEQDRRDYRRSYSANWS
ncbi:S1 family peptidase [Streptomyces sp. ADMS]|uniref:S1 family peptidase n=1 Tax=Streptomyces sp. ADMS TaxID=3071415 RepID=UPI00296FC186|nr:S1 family peptidase [Streptomyces sp. ADMS]MDW4905301.1 S1 family peptidase [Streptomyces sp. ADMS]